MSACIGLLGLIPAGTSLTDLYLKLLGSQVAGYYDSDTKELYVVSKSGAARADREDHLRPRVRPRAPGPELRPVQAPARFDRPGRPQLARLSIPEGDATELMTDWAQQPT